MGLLELCTRALSRNFGPLNASRENPGLGSPEAGGVTAVI
jgi:hypothetical protein